MKIWPFGGKKEEVAMLPPPENAQRNLPYPRRAAHGDKFRTVAYLVNPDDESRGVEYMRAVQVDGEFMIFTVTEGHPNTKSDEFSVSEKLFSMAELTDKEKDFFTYWEAVEILARFEINARQHERVQAGKSAQELGLEHYVAFARAGKDIDFRLDGMPALVVHGVPVDGRDFLLRDIQDLAERFERSKTENNNALGWEKGFLAGVFGSQNGGKVDYDAVIRNLQLKGYIEEFAAAVQGMKSTLSLFETYFDGAQREKAVDAWLAEARADVFRALLPAQFRAAGLSPRAILDSAALKEAAKSAPEKTAPFIAAVEKANEKHAQSLEDAFSADLTRAKKAVKNMNDFMRKDAGNDVGAFSAKKLDALLTGIELVYFTYKAKAQYEFTRHVRGNRDENLERLEKIFARMRTLCDALAESKGQGAEYFSSLRGDILKNLRPSQPAFIDEALEEYNRAAGNCDAETASPAGQLGLDLTGGENGLTKFKTDIDLDQFLDFVRKEKNGRDVEELARELKKLKLAQPAQGGGSSKMRLRL